MHVRLDGSEVTAALVAAAKAKLGIADEERCEVETALFAGGKQLDPAQCGALVKVSPVVRPASRRAVCKRR
jgi:hypothetical protein